MPWLPKSNIIVPADFSDASFGAVTVALEIADKPEHVHVVHVLPELSPVEPGVVWGDVSDESRIDHAKKSLQKQLEERGCGGVEANVLIGEPGSQIADLAHHTKADLIVIPSHGRSAIARILLGSVADRVVRLASCPVIVLKH